MSLSGASSRPQERPRHHSVKHGGNYLYTMCDRSGQAAQFNLFFKPNLFKRPRLPQFYLLHGEVGQGHNSFVQRLIIDKIKPYASAVQGALEGAVHHIKPWIHPLDNLDDAKESFKTSIFEEIAPEYDPTNTSIQKLCSHPKLKPFPFVIIQHDFIVSDWGKQLKILVDWYLTTYWMESALEESRIQFLMFLSFVYPSSGNSIWSRLLPSVRFEKSTFKEFLRNLSASLNKTYPCLLFEELSHPDKSDVCRTLGELGFHDDDGCPDWLDELFRRKRGKVKMTDIEKLLNNVHPTTLFGQ
jgi:iSTAND domain-containing protein